MGRSPKRTVIERALKRQKLKGQRRIFMPFMYDEPRHYTTVFRTWSTWNHRDSDPWNYHLRWNYLPLARVICRKSWLTLRQRALKWNNPFITCMIVKHKFKKSSLNTKTPKRFCEHGINFAIDCRFSSKYPIRLN